VVDIGEGRRVVAALLQPLEPGDKARTALRPENVAIGRQDGANSFTAKVSDRRYQGTQTVYDGFVWASARGARTRHRGPALGRVEATVRLPSQACWAYRDTGRRRTISLRKLNPPTQSRPVILEVRAERASKHDWPPLQPVGAAPFETRDARSFSSG